MEALSLFRKNEKLNSDPLSPILKWPGGKTKELKYIHPLLPEVFNDYYEPFVGGGAVFFSINSENYFINDKSHELIDLYLAIQRQDEKFLNTLFEIDENWGKIEKIIYNNKNEIILLYKKFSLCEIEDEEIFEWVNDFILKHSDEFNGMFTAKFNIDVDNFLSEIKRNLVAKIIRMRKIENEKWELPNNDILDNFESALKSAFYMHFRYLYNNTKRLSISSSKGSAIFYFVRSYTYSGMFRYNKKGEFNVPYGGIGYNRKRLGKKISYFKSRDIHEKLLKTNLKCLDFEEFFQKYTPTEDDFVFLDPPYDSDFSTYAKNTFGKNDQVRLANFLIEKCRAKWMLVIKNTEFIYSLYDHAGINISSFDKNYLVSFQNRNDKSAEHLIIRNYE